MISEEQQERAALYALGLLAADEAEAFERETAASEELCVFAVELSEAAAEAARLTCNTAPPAGLKERVLAQVQDDLHAVQPAEGKVITGPSAWRRWVPWSIAAALAVSCGILGSRYFVLASEVAVDRYYASSRQTGTLRQIAFCPLEPIQAAQQTGPQATVLWDAAKRRGVLRIAKLPPAGDGKDYQLWTVEEGHKDPLNTGVVKIGPDGSTEVEFQPEGDDGKAPVVAFALSVERAGGVPKSEGSIIYLGKL